MIPLLLDLATPDVTLRVAAEQGAQVSPTDLGATALVTGGEASFSARATGPESALGLFARGLYGRIWGSANGAAPAMDALSFSLSADAGASLSPRVHVSITTQDYLANRFGVRATDALAARDPFLFGSRLEYTTSADAGLSAILSPRTTLKLGGGYEQSGGLAASRPEAVGVDTHAPRASLGFVYELSPKDSLTPELRYSFTHFYHALYDVDLHRGPADIHALTATVGEERMFSRRLLCTAGVGFTVATPPPILKTRALTVSPEARLSFSYLSHHARIAAAYAYGFSSLGPRVGAGNEHTGSVEIAVRPLDGAKYRDLLVRGVIRAALGSAPVAANPPLNTGSSPLPPATGQLTTTTVAAGGSVEVPLRRGLVAFGGVDLSLTRGTFDPAPPTGQTGVELLSVVTLGIAATFSTDPRETVRRDPEEEDDEARRQERASKPQGSPEDTRPPEGTLPLPDR